MTGHPLPLVYRIFECGRDTLPTLIEYGVGGGRAGLAPPHGSGHSASTQGGSGELVQLVGGVYRRPAGQSGTPPHHGVVGY